VDRPRVALIRALNSVAWLLSAAAKAANYASAGLMRRRDLESAIERAWEEHDRTSWALEPGLMEWEEKFYLRFLRSGDRVLLVGCGSGRDLLPLLEHGYECAGLDLGREAIAACRRALDCKGLKAPLFVGSVVSAEVEGMFDTVIFSWFCFSYISGTAQRIAALRRLKGLRRPRGRILLSYFRNAPPLNRIPCRLARVLSRLTRSDWTPEYGDYIEMWGSRGEPVVHFEHRFSRGEFQREAAAAGLAIAFEEEHEGVLAVLTVS
jgi:SAM-dependent methyltransferase